MEEMNKFFPSEINQNPLNQPIPTQVYQTPQVSQTPGQQPSKRWLVKSLLIGILGGIIFGFGAGMLAVFILSLQVFSSGPTNLAGILVFLIFYPVALVAGIVFCFWTLFLGYRFHKGMSLGNVTLLITELLFVLSGIGWGLFSGLEITLNRLKDFIPIFGVFQDANYFILYAIVGVLGGCMFFMIGLLYTKKINFSTFIKHPLFLIPLTFFITVIVGFFLFVFENKQIAKEVNNIKLTNISGKITQTTYSQQAFKEKYKIEITADLVNPSKNNTYEIQAELDREGGCPIVNPVRMYISPDTSSLKFEFEQSGIAEEWGVSNICIYNRNCSCNFFYSFYGKYMQHFSEIHSEPVKILDYPVIQREK